MNSGLAHQLDLFARRLAPFGFTLMLVLFEAVPVPVPDFLPAMPALSFISIYYWTVHRPDLLPPVAVFFIGLLLDVVTGTLMGANALVLLLIWGLIVSQRRFLLEWAAHIVWAAFIFNVVLWGGLLWALQSAFSGVALGVGPLAGQLLLTVLLYPPVVWVLSRTRRGLREAE